MTSLTLRRQVLWLSLMSATFSAYTWQRASLWSAVLIFETHVAVTWWSHQWIAVWWHQFYYSESSFFFLLMHTTGITCDFGPQRALLHMSFDEERPMNSAFDLSRFCGRAFITAWTSIQRLKVAYTLGLSMHGVHCLQRDVLSVVITPTPTSGDVWASTPPGRTR